jgi:uncharacterized protein YndB with AHSA1/START domain
MKMAKEKFTLEYTFNSSPKILYNRLSTASGLSEWFADDVHVRGKHFVFVWDGTENQAELLCRKDSKLVRFKWIGEEYEGDEEAYFEFQIRKEELTGDVALIITDYAEEDEKESAIDLWDSQVSELKHLLGG